MHTIPFTLKSWQAIVRSAWDMIRRRVALNMRGRAVIAVMGLLVYTLAMVGFVMVKKQALLHEFNEMQELYGAEHSLRELRISAFHSLLATHDASTAGDPDTAMARMQVDFQLVESSYTALLTRLRVAKVYEQDILAHLQLATENLAERNPAALQDSLTKLIRAVEERNGSVRDSLDASIASYQRQSNELTHTAFTLAILGVVLFGFTVGLFFTNLADDLNRIKAKALDIVQGRRGEALTIDRYDELGELMQAVNKMQDDLARQELALDMERQKGFHREKMAAIGTLAAGIAHEIGNPITAISGIAQEMRGVQFTHQCPAAGGGCRPDMILEQTERIARITRAVSEFSAPRGQDRELLDLNQLVRSTASLLRYDRRFRNIGLELALDDQMPAIVGIGDQLVQVAMNLMLNAADACQELPPERAHISVTTRGLLDRVELCVSDNGAGMDAVTLTRATEAFFTTKPVGKGTGLGLAVCASVIDSHGGYLNLKSSQAGGTRVCVTLPIDLPHEEERA